LLTTDVVGGVWDFCLTLATALLERDAVCVTLLALGDPSRDQRDMAAALGVEIRSAPLKLEWMEDSAADVAATALLVADVAREVRADVIHANQFAAVCAPSDVPVVLTLHSDVLSWRKWTLADASVPPEWDAYATLVRDALRRADSVVAVSRFLADEVASLYGVRRTINVIHNGWPAPTLSEHVRRGTLLAGRVWDAAKNITLAADAAYGWAPGEVAVAGEQVHPQGGIAPLPAPLQPLGLLPRAQLDAWLMKTAVYLSPARYDPFGLLPLQAALHGCALLLSDIPSYRELWTGAARFFTANDSDDLRDQWQRLLTDDALRTDLAHRAAKRAATYTPRRLADSYHAQYREATARIAA
jgi:glycosyltransferase involved in cell wall biosynthesis